MENKNKRKREVKDEQDSNSDISKENLEAEEEKDLVLDEPIEDEEVSGEDLMEDMEKDYKPIPELDQYEQHGLDEDEYSDLDVQVRQKAEAEMDQRDRAQIAFDRKMPQAVFDFEGEEDEIQMEMRERRMRERFTDLDIEEDEPEEEKFLDFEDAKGKLHLWVKEPRTVRWIRKKFKNFLAGFRESEKGRSIYLDKIHEMCQANKASLEVDINDLASKAYTIAVWVQDEPGIIIPYLNAVAFELAITLYPHYESIHPEILVKITKLKYLEQLRDLRQENLNKLIKVKGVITRRSVVYSQLKKIYYICNKCGDRKGPIYSDHTQEVKLGACPVCQSNGPFSIDSENTLYRNYQKIIIQESPGTVPPGRVPRHKDVILLGDNIDAARPGDEVEITGIFTNRFDFALNVKHGFPIFYTLIEANHIRRMQDIDTSGIPEDEKKEIRKMSKIPNIGRKIINSIAPSIYGHYHVKTALALAMFGGQSKDVSGKHRIRGDINCLILGDPGTAKSQFLKYVEKTFPRCVFTTGKGASAVGLTASVRRDPSTKEWTLEGGALVLADKGICLIDEFDKMNEHDRTSIHEAMEQQTISISKAGIVANLQARCSVIAAANPIKGRYDSQLSFADNVDLTEPILSRFDVLCVVKDEVDEEIDSKLATFVINSHIKNHPKNKNYSEDELKNRLERILLSESNRRNEKDLISQEMFKKYVSYSRQFVHPKISGIDKDKITKFYTDLRQESSVSGGLSIAVRHIESIIRMAEAHAKMHLREIVRDDDIDMAISVMLQSFIQSQKFSVSRLITKKFSKYLTFREENNSIVMHVLKRLVRDHFNYMQFLRGDQQINEVKIPLDELETEMKNMNIYDLNEFFNSSEFKEQYNLAGRVIVKKLIHA